MLALPVLCPVLDSAAKPYALAPLSPTGADPPEPAPLGNMYVRLRTQ